jgi:pimeloyl-ACP methyl ester carboxylesterase
VEHASKRFTAVLTAVVACTTSRPSTTTQATPPDSARPAAPAAPPVEARLPDHDAEAWAPLGAVDGPHEALSLGPGRPIWYGRSPNGPARLVAHLHGMCGPPAYACGKWIHAGTEAGVLVCPTGNARCGDSGIGPPSWEAPSWPELVSTMNQDLEGSIAKVKGKIPIEREDAILTGYSRGAFAAAVLATTHPGRWPHLLLIEANAPLRAEALVRARVKNVALVAGERGTEHAGMQKTADALSAEGYPARLFTMRNTGHLYSDDMEHVMHAALTFLLN